MPAINRRIAFALIIFDLFILVALRILGQLPHLVSLILICQEILGISIASTFIMILQSTVHLLFEKGVIKKKLHYAAITFLNISATFLVSNYLVLPLLEPFPSSSIILRWLTFAVLITGIASLIGLVGLSFLRGIPKSEDFDTSQKLVHYQDKSLVFKGKKRDMALCILKLASRSTTDPRSRRIRGFLDKNERAHARVLEDEFLDYSHLTSLWSNVPDFSIEFRLEDGLTSVYFFTLATDSDTKRATKLAEEKAEKLRSIFQTRFCTKIEFLQNQQLWNIYSSLLGRDTVYAVKPESEFLKIGGIQRSQRRFVAVSVLRLESSGTVTMDPPQARAEQFLSTFAKERLTASLVIHLEAAGSPSIHSDSKLIEKARNDPDMKVLLELGEKRREAREERQAQLSGYWNVSAYIVYRGCTEEETRLVQEKGDTCAEAAYSSPNGRMKSERLQGKRISKRLNNLMTRRGIGITTVKASSRQVASMIELPDRQVAGIPETEIPIFDLPPREELENGEITIGTVMHDENEVCPLRMKLEDLMLHTVIFGETGFGKTRLIMNLLQAISSYNVAWTLIEMKGEYKPLVKLVDRVVYLRPASKIAPVRISLFDPQTEKPETHAKRIFAILKETFSTLFTDQTKELSAQMERVFYEALVSYMTSTTLSAQNEISHNNGKAGATAPFEQKHEEVKRSRNWAGFNDWLKDYARRHGSSSLPQIESTIQALLNRLDSFTRTPLNEVFNHDKSNLCFGDLVRRRTIIDLSEINANGAAEDLRLISNIITKYVAIAAQQRGTQDHLKHILVIDDALEVVPEILTRRTTAETGITEQMVLLLRSTGQGVIISTQRPNISQNIVANSATKIFLRTTVDSEKAAKWLNLNEEQANYLRVMPKMEAIVLTPKHSKPVRIKTVRTDIPSVDNHDVIINNMINYPIIYDTETTDNIPERTTRNIEKKDIAIATATHAEVNRLKTIAEEAFQAGDYNEALRVYGKALEAIRGRQGVKVTPQRGSIEHEKTLGAYPEPSLSRSQAESSRQLVPPANHALKPTSHQFHVASDQQDERTPQPRKQITLNLNDQSPVHKSEQVQSQLKQAFKHTQEIIDETTLKTRLNMETLQQLERQITPLVATNLIGEITAPDYKSLEPHTTKLYYQITDHQTRDILQEHITTTLYKDLHTKGISTAWIDQNMELLTTTNNNHNQNQYIITTWTHNTIDPTTTLTRLQRIRQQLQNEQIKELIIVLPWRNEAEKLRKLIKHLKLQGITPIPFNENETNKLINHITYGTPITT